MTLKDMHVKDIIREGQYWLTREGKKVRIDYIFQDGVNGYSEVDLISGEDGFCRYMNGNVLKNKDHAADLKCKIPSIYVAGGMSGYPDLNYPAFNKESALLRSQGYHVENPAENPDPYGKDWQCYMRKAVAQLIKCDRIHLLEGWSKSRGAKVEYTLALGMGLEITFQNEKAANEKI